MLRYTDSIHVNRPPSGVFDVVGTRIFDTQPLWEKEVVAIRRVTPGAMDVGSKSMMERRDFGQRSEANEAGNAQYTSNGREACSPLEARLRQFRGERAGSDRVSEGVMGTG